MSNTIVQLTQPGWLVAQCDKWFPLFQGEKEDPKQENLTTHPNTSADGALDDMEDAKWMAVILAKLRRVLKEQQ